MGIDKDRITFLMGEIQNALSILKEFREEEKGKVISDPKSLGSIKYYLIIATEACIDICNHIIAKESFGVPESYADCFKILGERGIISRNLSRKLINMAKFRNLLVHLYWKVDDQKVNEILEKELTDFDEFIKQIARKYL